MACAVTWLRYCSAQGGAKLTLRKLIVLLAFPLFGCVETAQPVSPAVAKLQAACNGGDLQSCAVVADMENQRQVAAAQNPWQYNAYQNDPGAFLSTSPPRSVMCYPNAYGATICQ